MNSTHQYLSKTINTLVIYMKSLLFFVFSLISFLSFSQKNEPQIFLVQQGKNIKIKKAQATIDKAPFQLIYQFKEPQSWRLIAGSKANMQEAFLNGADAIQEIIQKSDFGGADSYFNQDKSIRAWNGKINTGITYDDNQHHSFDSLYKKGDWIFGVRTVNFLSTEDDELMVEEWPDSVLVIATGNTEYKANAAVVTSTVMLKLKLIEIPNTSPLDVKGKSFIEEGKAVFQEGCEGCGNLGSFDFKKNGKEVEYLRSGSDIGSYGTYHQEKNQLTIGEGVMSFTVSDDGKQLTDNATGTKYKIR